MCLFSRVPPNLFTLMYIVSKKNTTTNPHMAEIAPANCKSTFVKVIKIGVK